MRRLMIFADELWNTREEYCPKKNLTNSIVFTIHPQQD
jgi:hypothetical protein